MTITDLQTDLTGFFTNTIDNTIFICSGLAFEHKEAKEPNDLYQLAVLDKTTLITKDNLFILFKEVDGAVHLVYKGKYYKVVSSLNDNLILEQNGTQYFI